MDYELQKQERIITKDWTGERNEKIFSVQKRLVDRMFSKINKPAVSAQACQTEERWIPEEEYQRILNLNTSFHKQLANNGQVFAMKEKQIEQLERDFLLADLNWKRAER